MNKLKYFPLTLLFFVSLVTLGQAPQEMNYQAVLRDAQGDLIDPAQSIALRFSILDESATGTVLFTETHLTNPDQSGRVNLVIGKGTTTDDFSLIEWHGGEKWLRTEVDLAGGSNYVVLGETKFVSVPYALNGMTKAQADFLNGLMQTGLGPGDILNKLWTAGDPWLDTRDGNVYKTVQIGGQVWMAESMRYSTGNEVCYKNIPANCEEYGALYTWGDVMQGESGSDAIPSGVQGVCPAGWHVPSLEETNELQGAVGDYSSGGTKLKESGFDHWRSSGTPIEGTDDFGFSARAQGYYKGSLSTFREIDYSFSMWTTSEISSIGNANIRSVASAHSTFFITSLDKNIDLTAVRCVKD